MIYEKNADGTGVVTEVLPRKNYLSRKAPRQKGAGYKGERLEQIIASNIDNFIIIVSFNDPPFNNRTLDRFIVAGESSGIPLSIVFNKSDLSTATELIEWITLYKNIGYTVVTTSTINGTGKEELYKITSKGKNLFWGVSGVGKSSLLNMLYPEAKQQIGDISTYTNKGKHTTVNVTMFKVSETSYIIDTPGIREIEPYGIDAGDLCHYFREFEPFLGLCRYHRCTHNHEPGCEIEQAVNDGKISAERYESYLRILESISEEDSY